LAFRKALKYRYFGLSSPKKSTSKTEQIAEYKYFGKTCIISCICLLDKNLRKLSAADFEKTSLQSKKNSFFVKKGLDNRIENW